MFLGIYFWKYVFVIIKKNYKTLRKEVRETGEIGKIRKGKR